MYVPIPSPAGRTLEDLKTSPLGVLILLRVADKPFESCLDSVDDQAASLLLCSS